ncbi:hypothetical protein BDV98DRAFT_440534 [Pterulicium gracile]|uniref:Uncharacterized protein n=1 Tax=Pterulicium gracile TaxID=1884261 RepID=A0A5C3Q471_9AGAR|nr:hypothetical protein BDV98DRAFT_440534 [Pterula gracilis]
MLNWPNRKHTNNFIPLEQEPFFFNPSDVKLDNFLYDDGASKLYIVDWQHVNALPHSFASFYFHRSQDPFVKAIAERLTLAVSPNLPAMQTIASKIRQTGNRTGNPKYPPIQQKEVLNSSSLEARQTF